MPELIEVPAGTVYTPPLTMTFTTVWYRYRLVALVGVAAAARICTGLWKPTGVLKSVVVPRLTTRLAVHSPVLLHCWPDSPTAR